MGWVSAVGLIQEIHTRILCGVAGPSSLFLDERFQFVRGRVVPCFEGRAARECWSLYIDDFQRTSCLVSHMNRYNV